MMYPLFNLDELIMTFLMGTEFLVRVCALPVLNCSFSDYAVLFFTTKPNNS